MNEKMNYKRLNELLDELIKIVKSNNPKSHIEIIKDINKEVKELTKK